eukprot:COSAG06_NODE_8004_length_2306_cov_1.364295_2_plen_89_part_01
MSAVPRPSRSLQAALSHCQSWPCCYMTCVNVVCLLHRLNPCIHADINADINNIRRGRKPSQDAFTTAIASQLASDPASPLRGVASALTW